RPILRASSDLAGRCLTIQAHHDALGDYKLHCESASDLLFTENETNSERIFAFPNPHRFVKDGINDFVVQGRAEAVNPERVGTKAAAHYVFAIDPGASAVVRLWFGRVGEAAATERAGEPGRKVRSDFSHPMLDSEAFAEFETVFAARRQEA